MGVRSHQHGATKVYCGTIGTAVVAVEVFAAPAFLALLLVVGVMIALSLVWGMR